MNSFKYLKDEIYLDSDVRNQLINDVVNDVMNRKTDLGADAAYYQPKKWNDSHYIWLVDLIKDKVEKKLNEKLKVTNYWLMEWCYGDKSEPHIHNNVKWVAIYYFEAPEGSGALYFNDLNEIIHPYTGLLIIHKSNLFHQVLGNTNPNIKRYNLVINFRAYYDESI